MKTSRAAVLTQYEAPLELKEFPLPPVIEPGAALVKVKLAGICGTDVHLWHGQLPIPLPVILGHETVGVIEELGEGATGPASRSRLAIALAGALRSTVANVTTAAPNLNQLVVSAEKRMASPTRVMTRRIYKAVTRITSTCGRGQQFLKFRKRCRLKQ
jgi:NADPH:quinone reductase-like Zn-dependent oxidoreductase